MERLRGRKGKGKMTKLYFNLRKTNTRIKLKENTINISAHTSYLSVLTPLATLTATHRVPVFSGACFPYGKYFLLMLPSRLIKVERRIVAQNTWKESSTGLPIICLFTTW